MKQLLLGTSLLLLALTALSNIHCPEPMSIKRVAGEYAWSSQDGRWQGYFASPRIGRGDSQSVTFFKGSRWIQLTDLPDSPGVIECDYTGNYGNETIRFVSTNSLASSKPTNTYWMCEVNPELPSTQCHCSGTPQQCELAL